MHCKYDTDPLMRLQCVPSYVRYTDSRTALRAQHHLRDGDDALDLAACPSPTIAVFLDMPSRALDRSHEVLEVVHDILGGEVELSIKLLARTW